MPDIIKVVQGILTKDPEYVAVGPRIFNYEMFRYFQLFTFGERTEKALMELTFGCQGCGDCCQKVTRKDGVACSDGYCPSLKHDKKCDRYRAESYPLQCEIYPFMLPTIATAVKGMGFEQSNQMRTHFVYEFGFLDDLDLVIADYDEGWLKGQIKIGEIYEGVKKTILGSEGRLAVPDWGDDDGYEVIFLEHLANLRKTLSKNGAGSRI